MATKKTITKAPPLNSSLSTLLDALVDTNFQEADDMLDADEEYERANAAKLFLFQLATRLTNGYREKKE